MKASSNIEQQNCRGHEKRDVSLKMEVNYENSQRKKFYFLILFSQIGVILAKSVHHKLFCNFKVIYFFSSKFKSWRFQKKCVSFFRFPCVRYFFPSVSWLCFVIFKLLLAISCLVFGEFLLRRIGNLLANVAALFVASDCRFLSVRCREGIAWGPNYWGQVRRPFVAKGFVFFPIER